MEYPYNLTQEEVIKRITKVYHAGYDLNNPNFDVYNQLLACEAVAEAEEEAGAKNYQEYEETKGSVSVSVSENDNDTCKLKVNFELSDSKLRVIERLKECDYRTQPVIIATYLEEFFQDCNSKPGHWLYVAQHYPPRPIVRVITQLVKIQTTGAQTIKNPAAYFTYLIKFRTGRKSLRNINGSYKRQNSGGRVTHDN